MEPVLQTKAKVSVEFILAAAIFVCWAILAKAQNPVGGAYEIGITWGSASHTVTSSYEVMPGETVQISVGEDMLSLAVLPAGDSDVDLQVAVTRDAPNVAPVAVSETRRGSLGTPISLRDSEDKVAFPSGVVVTVRQLIR